MKYTKSIKPLISNSKFTKAVYLACICLFLLCCSVVAQRTQQNNVLRNDATVCSEYLPSIDTVYEEKEFFVVTKQDTSAYSCLFTKSEKHLRLKLVLSLEWKLYDFFNHQNNEPNDTTAFRGILNIPKHSLKIPSYKDLLNEIRLCLNAADKDYDISTLHSFKCQLSDLGDIAVSTTNNLNTKPTLENGLYEYSSILDALKMTSFENDMNKIFEEYGIKVKSIWCQEVQESFPKETFLKSQNLSKNITVPDSIVDVQVCMNFMPQ